MSNAKATSDVVSDTEPVIEKATSDIMTDSEPTNENTISADVSDLDSETAGEKDTSSNSEPTDEKATSSKPTSGFAGGKLIVNRMSAPSSH